MAGLDSLFQDRLSVSEYQDYRVSVSTQLLGFFFFFFWSWGSELWFS